MTEQTNLPTPAPKGNLAENLQKNPGLIKELWYQIQLVYRLMVDGEVPFYLKLLPVAALAYIISPVDLAPDVLPGLGQLDDLTVLLLALRFFVGFVPTHIVEEHRQKIYKLEAGGPIIDQDGLDNSIVINQKEP